MIKCPFCHYDNEDGALFCERCTSDLSNVAPAPAAKAPPPPPPPPVPRPAHAVPVEAIPMASALPLEGVPVVVEAVPLDFAQPGEGMPMALAEPIEGIPLNALAVPVAVPAIDLVRAEPSAPAIPQTSSASAQDSCSGAN